MTQDILIRLRGVDGGGLDPMLLIVVGVAILGFVLFAVVYLQSLRSSRGRLETLFNERAERISSGKWPIRFGVVVLLFAALFMAERYLGDERQCAQCHRDAKQAKALETTSHKGLGCVSCHKPAGAAGSAEFVADYSRWMWVYASTKKAPEPRSGSVGNQECLRCHDSVRSGVDEARGIRVRHSDFLEEGAKCRDCHNSVAHANAVSQPSRPSMDKCLPCHDGREAPSDCGTCHVKDAGEYRAATELPKVKDLETGDCYSCHEERPCISCHGVTMPHPKNWMPTGEASMRAGLHAKEAFVNRDVCWRCHHQPGQVFVADTSLCNGCHRTPGKMHGGAAWVKEHSLQATGKKAGQYSQCVECHGEEICAVCHHADWFDEYYKPLPPGPDDYQRDIPFDPDYYEY